MAVAVTMRLALPSFAFASGGQPPPPPIVASILTPLGGVAGPVVAPVGSVASIVPPPQAPQSALPTPPQLPESGAAQRPLSGVSTSVQGLPAVVATVGQTVQSTATIPQTLPSGGPPSANPAKPQQSGAGQAIDAVQPVVAAAASPVQAIAAAAQPVITDLSNVVQAAADAAPVTQLTAGAATTPVQAVTAGSTGAVQTIVPAIAPPLPQAATDPGAAVQRAITAPPATAASTAASLLNVVDPAIAPPAVQASIDLMGSPSAPQSRAAGEQQPPSSFVLQDGAAGAAAVAPVAQAAVQLTSAPVSPPSTAEIETPASALQREAVTPSQAGGNDEAITSLQFAALQGRSAGAVGPSAQPVGLVYAAPRRAATDTVAVSAAGTGGLLNPAPRLTNRRDTAEAAAIAPLLSVDGTAHAIHGQRGAAGSSPPASTGGTPGATSGFGSGGHSDGFTACLATLALLAIALHYLRTRMAVVRRPLALACVPIVPPH